MTLDRPRLAFLRPFGERDQADLRAHLGAEWALVEPAGYDEDSLAKAIGDVDAVLTASMSEALLARAPRLRFIQTPGAGIDGLDTAAIRRAGIVVANSHSNAPCVAEHTIAMVLDLIRKLSLNDRRMRLGSSAFDRGTTLTDSTVAILGLGHIGAELVKLLAPFCARLIGVAQRPERHSALQASFPALGQAPLDEALAVADVVIVALPLTPATFGILSARALAKLKPGATLVSISRAEIIDKVALLESLRSGSLGGVGLDVWWSKDPVADAATFREFDNVLLSPHLAGVHRDFTTHLAGVVANLLAFARGEPIPNLVDLDRGY